jgi:hypothetical protein
LRTNRDLESTATVLGRTEDEIREALGGSDRRPDGRDGEKPAVARPPRTEGSGRAPGGGHREGRQRPAAGGETDYRFGGDFWVVLDTAGQEVRKVRTGVTDLDRVEVVSGLDETDRVLVLPSSHLLQTQQDLQNFINRRVGGVPGIN